VSALDVSVRAQILQLIRNLEEEFGLTYLFISHDLAVLRSICKRVTIMYLGKVVEEGSAEDIFTRPVHPYTKALLASTPLPNPHKTQWLEIPILEGEIPSPIDPPSGCRFHTRCPIAKSSCRLEEPRMLEVARDHSVVCWAVTDQS
jgi:oligopeptide/dipeptide ABC transporter ATP-binding protein